MTNTTRDSKASLAHRLLGGRPPRLGFRGWRVVLGAFITSMVGFGAIYSYGVFAPRLVAAFGISAASASMLLSLSTGAAFAVSALSGPLREVFGCRALAIAGVLTLSLGLLLGAGATTAPMLFLSYGALVGIGTGLAYVPAFAAIQRWFVDWRGLASGIGVGTLLITPMADMLERFGDWRVEFRICAMLAAIVGVGGALLLADAPEESGDHPDDRPRVSMASDPADEATLGEAMRSAAFGWTYAGILLVSIAVVVPYGHLVASAVADGWNTHDALALLSVIGMGSIVGRVLVAAIADRFGRRAVFLGSCAGIAVATAAWALARGPALHGFALVFGLLYGGFVALLPAFVADMFGRRHAAGVMGLLYTGRALAGVIAPPLVAIAVAQGTGYALPLAGIGLLAAAGVVLLLRVRAPRDAVSALTQTALR